MSRRLKRLTPATETLKELPEVAARKPKGLGVMLSGLSEDANTVVGALLDHATGIQKQCFNRWTATKKSIIREYLWGKLNWDMPRVNAVFTELGDALS